MKKIIMLVGFVMLLASPASFAQSYSAGYGTGNVMTPGDLKANIASGYYSTWFLGAPSGAAGAFAYQPSTVQDCAHRFKSYDSRSGTYLGRDGYRHSCP